MRCSSVKWVLASTLPLALGACGEADKKVTVTRQGEYTSVQACVDAEIPADVCAGAYMRALADHRAIAPTYANRDDCDADFVAGYCQPTANGMFAPTLGGFELSVSGEVPKAQAEAAAALGESSAGFDGSGLVTGLLIGHLLSNGLGTRYASQPIYQSRDSRGAYTTSTLARQIDEGKTFGRSTQARASGVGRYTSGTLAKGLGRSESVASTISRGGFGSQATARGGWSGKTAGGYGG